MAPNNNLALLGITQAHAAALAELPAARRAASLGKLRAFLASIYHPDHTGGGGEQMAAINIAFDQIQGYNFKGYVDNESSIWKDQLDFYKTTVQSLRRDNAVLSERLSAVLAPKINSEDMGEFRERREREKEARLDRAWGKIHSVEQMVWEVLCYIWKVRGVTSLCLSSPQSDNGLPLPNFIGEQIYGQLENSGWKGARRGGGLVIQEDLSVRYYRRNKFVGRGQYAGIILGAAAADTVFACSVGAKDTVLDMVLKLKYRWAPGMTIAVLQMRGVNKVPTIVLYATDPIQPENNNKEAPGGTES